MRVGIMLAALAAVAAGCGPAKEDLIRFDGQVFRTGASNVKGAETRAAFSSTAKPVSASFDGARAAAEYEGIRYCIENYGNSRIEWSVGPETDPATLTVEGDTLTFRGRCAP